jgi:hypothetical protein
MLNLNTQHNKMGLKQTAISLLARIAAIPTTDQDGNATTMHCAIWNNQIERKKEGSGYVYNTPAAFIELNFSDGMPIGQGVTSYEGLIRVTIEHQNYNTEGTIDQDMIIFDLTDKVHRSLNGYKPLNCSPLFLSNKILDYNHDNTALCILEYSTHFIDTTGSMWDEDTGLFIEDTLTNPTLVPVIIEAETLPTEPYDPIYMVGLFNCIEGIRLTPVEGGYMRVELYQATFINNIGAEPVEYRIDWGDGSEAESIEIGVLLSHRYMAAGISIMEISSIHGSAVQLEVVMDEQGQFSSYFPLFEQVFSYDLWSVFNPNYPVQIKSNMVITDGSIKDYTIEDQDQEVLHYIANPGFPVTNSVLVHYPDNAIFTYYHTTENDTQLGSVTILNLIEV